LTVTATTAAAAGLDGDKGGIIRFVSSKSAGAATGAALGDQGGMKGDINEAAAEIGMGGLRVTSLPGHLPAPVLAVCSAEVFDWNAVPSNQPKFDLVLACDVLYEAGAVGPVAALVPALTKSGGGRWLLADPPRRAPANR